MRNPKMWVSGLILLTLGLHALPVLSYQGFRQTRWPILAWAMYAKSRPPGPIETLRRHIVAITVGGARLEVTPGLVGVSGPTLGKSYARPLLDGDTATAQELFLRLNHQRTDPIVELRLERDQYVVSDSGILKYTLPLISYRAATPPTR